MEPTSSFNEVEGDNILQDPSSEENSCLDDIEGLGHIPDVISCTTQGADRSNGDSNKRQESAIDNTPNLNLCIAIVEDVKKSLEDLPALSHAKLVNKLVKNNQTMPDKIAPNAYCNMKKKKRVMERGLCERHTWQGKHSRKNLVIFGKSLS